jgi:hypothetical protein
MNKRREKMLCSSNQFESQASQRSRNIVRVMPLKWLEAFGIVEPSEIEKVRQRIIAQVRYEEARLAPQRAPSRRLDGFVVTDVYRPRKKQRKVFMHFSCRELRWTFLETFRRFINRCAECYLLVKQGSLDVPWPPGCFKPPTPPLCNAL